MQAVARQGLPLRRPHRRPHAPGRHRHRQHRDRLRRAVHPLATVQHAHRRPGSADVRRQGRRRDAAAADRRRTGLAARQADRNDRRISDRHAAIRRRRSAGEAGAFGLHALRPAGQQVLLDAAGRAGVPRAKPDGREADGFAGGAHAESGGLRRLGAAINGVEPRQIRRQRQRAAPRRQGRRVVDARRAGQGAVARQAGARLRRRESQSADADGRRTSEESHRDRDGKQPFRRR